nr:MAG TPA: hypothetical protein [Caudoviricetes sp.]
MTIFKYLLVILHKRKKPGNIAFQALSYTIALHFTYTLDK